MYYGKGIKCEYFLRSTTRGSRSDTTLKDLIKPKKVVRAVQVVCRYLPSSFVLFAALISSARQVAWGDILITVLDDSNGRIDPQSEGGGAAAVFPSQEATPCGGDIAGSENDGGRERRRQRAAPAEKTTRCTRVIMCGRPNIVARFVVKGKRQNMFNNEVSCVQTILILRVQAYATSWVRHRCIRRCGHDINVNKTTLHWK